MSDEKDRAIDSLTTSPTGDIAVTSTALVKRGLHLLDGHKLIEDAPITDVRERYNAGEASAHVNLDALCNYSRIEPDHLGTITIAELHERGNAGDMNAQYGLGFAYENGSRVEQDLAEAVRWYQKAAALGNVYAQFLVAVAYGRGKIVPQDVARAAHWYRKAAEQGHPSAQYNLAVMYANGVGVDKDHTEAVRWYRACAEQDDTAAQCILFEAYSEGRGVPRDDIEALKWITLAARSEDIWEDDEYVPEGFHPERRVARDYLAKRMLPNQVAEAQHQVREWIEMFKRRKQ
jgi:TPR repeat protein